MLTAGPEVNQGNPHLDPLGQAISLFDLVEELSKRLQDIEHGIFASHDFQKEQEFLKKQMATIKSAIGFLDDKTSLDNIDKILKRADVMISDIEIIKNAKNLLNDLSVDQNELKAKLLSVGLYERKNLCAIILNYLLVQMKNQALELASMEPSKTAIYAYHEHQGMLYLNIQRLGMLRFGFSAYPELERTSFYELQEFTAILLKQTIKGLYDRAYVIGQYQRMSRNIEELFRILESRFIENKELHKDQYTDLLNIMRMDCYIQMIQYHSMMGAFATCSKEVAEMSDYLATSENSFSQNVCQTLTSKLRDLCQSSKERKELTQVKILTEWNKAVIEAVQNNFAWEMQGNDQLVYPKNQEKLSRKEVKQFTSQLNRGLARSATDMQSADFLFRKVSILLTLYPMIRSTFATDFPKETVVDFQRFSYQLEELIRDFAPKEPLVEYILENMHLVNGFVCAHAKLRFVSVDGDSHVFFFQADLPFFFQELFDISCLNHDVRSLYLEKYLYFYSANLIQRNVFNDLINCISLKDRLVAQKGNMQDLPKEMLTEIIKDYDSLIWLSKSMIKIGEIYHPDCEELKTLKAFYYEKLFQASTCAYLSGSSSHDGIRKEMFENESHFLNDIPVFVTRLHTIKAPFYFTIVNAYLIEATKASSREAADGFIRMATETLDKTYALLCQYRTDQDWRTQVDKVHQEMQNKIKAIKESVSSEVKNMLPGPVTMMSTSISEHPLLKTMDLFLIDYDRLRSEVKSWLKNRNQHDLERGLGNLFESLSHESVNEPDKMKSISRSRLFANRLRIAEVCIPENKELISKCLYRSVFLQIESMNAHLEVFQEGEMLNNNVQAELKDLQACQESLKETFMSWHQNAKDLKTVVNDDVIQGVSKEIDKISSVISMMNQIDKNKDDFFKDKSLVQIQALDELMKIFLCQSILREIQTAMNVLNNTTTTGFLTSSAEEGLSDLTSYMNHLSVLNEFLMDGTVVKQSVLNSIQKIRQFRIDHLMKNYIQGRFVLGTYQEYSKKIIATFEDFENFFREIYPGLDKKEARQHSEMRILCLYSMMDYVASLGNFDNCEDFVKQINDCAKRCSETLGVSEFIFWHQFKKNHPYFNLEEKKKVIILNQNKNGPIIEQLKVWHNQVGEAFESNFVSDSSAVVALLPKKVELSKREVRLLASLLDQVVSGLKDYAAKPADLKSVNEKIALWVQLSAFFSKDWKVWTSPLITAFQTFSFVLKQDIRKFAQGAVYANYILEMIIAVDVMIIEHKSIRSVLLDEGVVVHTFESSRGAAFQREFSVISSINELEVRERSLKEYLETYQTQLSKREALIDLWKVIAEVNQATVSVVSKLDEKSKIVDQAIGQIELVKHLGCYALAKTLFKVIETFHSDAEDVAPMQAFFFEKLFYLMSQRQYFDKPDEFDELMNDLLDKQHAFMAVVPKLMQYDNIKTAFYFAYPAVFVKLADQTEKLKEKMDFLSKAMTALESIHAIMNTHPKTMEWQVSTDITYATIKTEIADKLFSLSLVKETSHTTEINTLKVTIEKLQEELRRKSEGLVSAENQVRNLKKNDKKANDLNESLKAKVLDLVSQIDQRNKDLNVLMEKIKEYEQALKQANLEAESSMLESERARQTVVVNEMEVTTLKKEVEDLKFQINALNEKMQSLVSPSETPASIDAITESMSTMTLEHKHTPKDWSKIYQQESACKTNYRITVDPEIYERVMEERRRGPAYLSGSTVFLSLFEKGKPGDVDIIVHNDSDIGNRFVKCLVLDHRYTDGCFDYKEVPLYDLKDVLQDSDLKISMLLAIPSSENNVMEVIDPHGVIAELLSPLLALNGVPSERISRDPSVALRAIHNGFRTGKYFDVETLLALQSAETNTLPFGIYRRKIANLFSGSWCAAFDYILNNEFLPVVFPFMKLSSLKLNTQPYLMEYMFKQMAEVDREGTMAGVQLYPENRLSYLFTLMLLPTFAAHMSAMNSDFDKAMVSTLNLSVHSFRFASKEDESAFRAKITSIMIKLSDGYLNFFQCKSQVQVSLQQQQPQPLTFRSRKSGGELSQLKTSEEIPPSLPQRAGPSGSQ